MRKDQPTPHPSHRIRPTGWIWSNGDVIKLEKEFPDVDQGWMDTDRALLPTERVSGSLERTTEDRGMNAFQKYLTEHRDHFVDAVRIFLGFILILKGTHLMQNMPDLEGSIMGLGGSYTVLFIAHYVLIANVVGGAFLIMGLLTRWVSLFNIPQLIGAVMLLGTGGGLFAAGSELPFALMTLLLLVVFALRGAGPVSADYFLYTWSRTHEGGTFHAVWERWVHHHH